MPKMKTKKAAAKRFTKTGTGKLMHESPGRGHLKMKKSASRNRRLTAGGQVSHGERDKVFKMVPTL